MAFKELLSMPPDLHFVLTSLSGKRERERKKEREREREREQRAKDSSRDYIQIRINYTTL